MNIVTKLYQTIVVCTLVALLLLVADLHGLVLYPVCSECHQHLTAQQKE